MVPLLVIMDTLCFLIIKSDIFFCCEDSFTVFVEISATGSGLSG